MRLTGNLGTCPNISWSHWQYSCAQRSLTESSEATSVLTLGERSKHVAKGVVKSLCGPISHQMVRQRVRLANTTQLQKLTLKIFTLVRGNALTI